MKQNGFARVISADSHVMEPAGLWQGTISKTFGDRTPRLIDEHLGQKGSYFYFGKQVVKEGESDVSAQVIGMQEAGYVPEVRVKFQEEAKIEAEALTATRMLLIMQHPDAECLKACAAVFNDWLAEFISYDRSRLVGIAMIPMDDIDWAINELDRVAKLGHKCANIHLDARPGRPPYQDSAYDPFWARAEEMGMPIQLHIVTGQTPDPLLFHTPEERINTPYVMLQVFYEIMGVLANEFIFGKILDRFPKLKMIVSEFEISWLPTFMWRLDQMQESFAVRLPLPKLDMRASDYVRTRMWHGMIDDAHGAEAIPHIGVDSILWGNDFPHIRSIGLDAQSRVGQLFADLDRTNQEKIIGGNAIAAFGL